MQELKTSAGLLWAYGGVHVESIPTSGRLIGVVVPCTHGSTSSGAVVSVIHAKAQMITLIPSHTLLHALGSSPLNNWELKGHIGYNGTTLGQIRLVPHNICVI